MSEGPLADRRLRAVDACLDDGRLDEAQRELTALGSQGDLGPGMTYLTTRLLFLRGRLDAKGVQGRLQEVMVECPDFPEAQALLRVTTPPGHDGAPLPILAGASPPSSARGASGTGRPTERAAPPHSTAPPPSGGLASNERRLQTPGVPSFDAPTAPAGIVDLGPLDLPRSELPTQPAPPPPEESTPPPFELGALERSAHGHRPWDDVDAHVAGGRARAALEALESLAIRALDPLRVNRIPEPRSVALAAMDFFSTAPAACHFAPYDLSLKSLERLDAFLSLLAPGTKDAPHPTLLLFVACYAGESVRSTRSGTWRGIVTDPASLVVEYSDESYHPHRHAEPAMRGARSLRVEAGPTLHPGAEPPEPCSRKPAEPPAPWDPAPWPTLAQVLELGRALPASAIGTWAARTLKVPLDRTFASVEAITRYLSLIGGPVPAPGGKAERRATILAGAYLGELVCLHRAGRWNENDAAPAGPLTYEVLLPDGNAAYPVLLAQHELTRRGGESLSERLAFALGRG